MGEQISYTKDVKKKNPKIDLYFYKKDQFKKIEKFKLSWILKKQVISNMLRTNILYMIQKSGSGHIGTSFSSVDLINFIYSEFLKKDDIYFSSKGHDVPALYSVLTMRSVIGFEKIHKFRRINGLPGHPDVATNGIWTNTGSLGMGISKAKGFLIANYLKKKRGKVIVLTGDGELQEGQFWESILKIPKRVSNNLILIIDNNKYQSDLLTSKTSNLTKLKNKLNAFNFKTFVCNGNNYSQIKKTFQKITNINSPKAIIANTVKGKGVSFIEASNLNEKDYYNYHSGALLHDQYIQAVNELSKKIKKTNLKLTRSNEPTLTKSLVKLPNVIDAHESFIEEYSDVICKIAKKNKKIMCLDADLVVDTGLKKFKHKYPKQFIECGIAEQDMVSIAGTLSSAGLTAIVHSFSSFLISRAAEQIYNNVTQKSKVVYVGSLSGGLPGAPGHSHQSLRDISLIASIPNFVIIEPVNVKELLSILLWSINKTRQSVFIRLNSIPFKKFKELKLSNKFYLGRGNLINLGKQATLICLGPLMTRQGLEVSKQLYKTHKIRIEIISTIFANSIDEKWYYKTLKKSTGPIFVLENHFNFNGFFSFICQKLLKYQISLKRNFFSIGFEKIPVCGSNDEVLSHHKLNIKSIIERILNEITKKRIRV